MYDRLWEEDPKIQQLKIESQAKMLLIIIEARFPSLKEIAQQRVAQISKSEDLIRLAKLIATIPHEAGARWLLDNLDNFSFNLS